MRGLATFGDSRSQSKLRHGRWWRQRPAWWPTSGLIPWIPWGEIKESAEPVREPQASHERYSRKKDGVRRGGRAVFIFVSVDSPIVSY